LRIAFAFQNFQRFTHDRARNIHFNRKIPLARQALAITQNAFKHQNLNALHNMHCRTLRRDFAKDFMFAHKAILKGKSPFGQYYLPQSINPAKCRV